MYIDKLNDIVNEWKNIYLRNIKKITVDAKSTTYIDFHTDKNDKDLTSKLVIMQEYQNVKTFWENITLQIGLRRFL